MRKIITASVITFATLAASVAFISHATAAPANHCKPLAQSDCTAAVACSWRETTTDGVTKTSCIYNSKAAREMIESKFAASH